MNNARQGNSSILICSHKKIENMKKLFEEVGLTSKAMWDDVYDDLKSNPLFKNAD